MKRRRIVLLMIEPPLPMGNAAARWYHVLLHGLLERGHEVVAFASCSNANDGAAAQKLFPELRCYPTSIDRTIRSRASSFVRPMSYLISRRLQLELDLELSRGFDVLHLEQLWSGWAGLRHVSRSVVNVHYLFEIDWKGSAPDSLARRITHARILRAERKLLRAYKNISTVSGRLAERVREINPSATVETSPLALDLALYPFTLSGGSGACPTVGLIGSFHWRPTYLAAVRLIDRIFPAIKKNLPNARLRIIGRSANEALARYRGKKDVEIISDVPDPIPHFRELDLLLYAPDVGSGMKVKILEAMALGTVIVTNTEGIEGIDARDGVEVALANDDAGLIARAVTLLQNPRLRQSYATAARRLVERVCDRANVIDRVERVHQRIAERKQ